MISAIISALSIVARLMGFASWAESMVKSAEDRSAGRQQQKDADDAATVKQATQAQKIDAAVADQSRAALIDELRGPTAG